MLFVVVGWLFVVASRGGLATSSVIAAAVTASVPATSTASLLSMASDLCMWLLLVVLIVE